MSVSQLFRRKSLQEIYHHHENQHEGQKLKRVLTVRDLTMFGIAAVIGAGVFSTIGSAAFTGGPAVILLFIFTAIACGFCALCYAEFASSVPIAGTAYTYSYLAFGEFIAWVIGWDLLMEYAISDIVLTISWSQYFVGLLKNYGITVPVHFTMDYFSAYHANEYVQALLTKGQSLTEIFNSIGDPLIRKGYEAWSSAPRLGGLAIIFDLPTILITTFVTAIIIRGIEGSKSFSTVMVVLKLAVLFFVVAVGAFYINPDNWVPFAPNGASGVMKGVSAVFFAYIGFDVISTTAEECKNPQKDLPKAMIYTLLICTLIYIILGLVVTGVVHYTQLQVGDPLAYIFGSEGANLPWFSSVIAVSAIVAIAGVLLVYQLGQTRIWMVMSRDGLLPSMFGKIHPHYKTPWISSIIAGLFVAIPSLFLNLREVTDLSSIGTLFAMLLVSAGVLVLDPYNRDTNKKFRMPYINGKYTFPALLLITALSFAFCQQQGYLTVFEFADFTETSRLFHKIPLFIFILELLALGVWSYLKSLSLIPLIAVSLSSYLITELGTVTWVRFGVWLIVGGLVYFCYGFKHSVLNKKADLNN